MYTEVFSSDSKVSHFNRALDRVKKDPQCTDLLGDSDKIIAYGDPQGRQSRVYRAIGIGVA